MPVISVDVPDSIVESHQNDIEKVQEEMQRGLVIWVYLNGRLSLRECGQLLHIGYRGFLELLWSREVPIDGLSSTEFDAQLSSLRTLLESS